MSLLLKRWIRQLDRFLRRFLISYLTDLRLQFDAAMTAPLVSSEQISEISRSQSVPFAGDLRGRRSWFLRCRGRYWAMVQRWGGPPCLVQRCTGDVDLHREVMKKLNLLSRCHWKVVVIVVLEQNSLNTADVQAADPCLRYLSYQHTSIESNIALGRHFPKNYIALAIALSMSHFLSDTVGDLKLQTTRSRCSSRRPMGLLFSFGIVEHNTWLIMVKWLECFA